jgi:LysM repeat protein
MSTPVPLPDQPRPRRSFSLWTLLAPVALVIVVVLLFNALGQSCVVNDKGCDKSTAKKKAPAAKASKSAKKLPRRYRVKKGENFGAIADRFGLSEAQLKKCNPKVTDPTNLGVGTVLAVRKCESIKTDDDPI